MFFQRYRYLCLCLLFVSVLLASDANAHETEWPGEKLAAIFPTAEKFVQRSVVLPPEKVASIEKKLGTQLLTEDKQPVFYIPLNQENEPFGVVLFAKAKGPGGLIEGAAGLNMQGKVVKVVIYAHKETDAIAGAKFLNQFVGKGIDNVFKAGEDVEAVDGQTEASNAVALIPKKTLIMSYTLFLKRETKPEPEGDPEPNNPEEDLPEVDDLKALMALMIDDYYVVLDYFDEKESKEKAVTSARRLATYAKLLSDFEPPKNPDQTEEYAYVKDMFTEKLLAFAEALEKEGVSDATREQWDAIVTLINQAHLRFSEEEIDLDAY